MITIDFSDKVVLVTGGTMGIGLASALKFGAAGAKTFLTQKWGTADEEAIMSSFEKVGAPKPTIIDADVVVDEDTSRLLSTIHESVDKIDVFVSNVAFAQRIEDTNDYTKRGLHRSIDYTAWPMWSYTNLIHERFGSYPKYIIGLSSDGPDSFFAYYDFVAMSKSVLETLCRYMNYRFYSHGVRVNIVRSRMVPTESFDATFGKSFHEFVNELRFDDCYVSPEEVASVVFALSSGLLDSIGGQVIMADRGFSFFDSLMGAYARSPHFPVKKQRE